ncbi:MAG: PEP-CTERM sorting domain-containing protein [Isosphaeraceae bacterium]|nr:PEP-CTERM sorting domain-containing protein [Isosphaeraceae bacterium]
MKIRFLAAALGIACASAASATEIAVWNFNDASGNSSTTPQEITDMLTVDRGVGLMTTSFGASDIRDVTGSLINASGGDAAGQAITFRSRLSEEVVIRDFTIQVSTLGLEDIIILMAMSRGSFGGIETVQVDISTDNATFSPAGVIEPTVLSLTSIAALQTLELSSFPAAENVATLFVRFTPIGDSGIITLDNLRVVGTSIPTTVVPEPTTIAPAVLGFAAFVVARRRRRAG